jgi:hypothetical protein
MSRYRDGRFDETPNNLSDCHPAVDLVRWFVLNDDENLGISILSPDEDWLPAPVRSCCRVCKLACACSKPALTDLEPDLRVARASRPFQISLRRVSFGNSVPTSAPQSACASAVSGQLPHDVRIEPEVCTERVVESASERQFTAEDLAKMLVAEPDVSSDFSNRLPSSGSLILASIISAYVLPLGRTTAPPKRAIPA